MNFMKSELASSRAAQSRRFARTGRSHPSELFLFVEPPAWRTTPGQQDKRRIFSAPGAFIGSIAVNAPDLNPGPFSVAMTNVSGGVSSVGAGHGGGPLGEFDFRFDLIGPKNDKLTSNESVEWTWTDSGLTSFTKFALHVQGLEYNTAGYSKSVWYSPTTPVPEPGTYGLMLAGLAAIGLTLRRRRT